MRPDPGRRVWAWVALLSLLGCARQGVEGEAIAEAAPSIGARWMKVEPAGDSSWFDVPGRVVTSPNDTALVSAPLTARIVRVRVEPGQLVRAGAPLLDVVMPDLIKAAGALRSAELRLQSWEERRATVDALLAKQLARAADLSEIRANIASVRSERESARAVLRTASEPDTRAEALLAHDAVLALRAPFAGVVTAVTAKVGEVREPGGGALVEVVSDEPDARIEARFVTTPPPGASFVWIEPARTVPLLLERLSPHADERDGSRTGWLRSAVAAPGLIAGTPGRVHMIAANDWVVVPARALRERGGVLTVQIKEPQGSRAAPVKLIQRGSSEALVGGIPRDALVAADARALPESAP